MKVAIYQANLATLGGGERYAFDFARYFRARGHDVDVLAPPGTPFERVEDRLGVDVSGLRLVELDPERTDEDASERSADYDCFVNVSFGSAAMNRARRLGILAVHFPDGPRERGPAVLAEAPDGGRNARAWAHMGGGIEWDPNAGWWTNGYGAIHITRAGSAPWVLKLDVANRHRSWRGGANKVELRLDGTVVRHARIPPVGGRTLRLDLPSTRGHSTHMVEIVSNTRPEPTGPRELGAYLRSVSLSAPGSTDVPDRPGPLHAPSYDLIVANSAFTSRWIEEWWQMPSEVVHPAVDDIGLPDAETDGGERDRSIVVVGRFFSGGHSKRQVELARAFGRMCDGGLEGWTLELIGGVDADRGEAYLNLVRQAAEGHPVRLTIGASREELVTKLNRASIQWQASGWGSDPDEEPERFEHFGIALVEGMSAGAVPVALGVGGASEIVEHEKSGLLWLDGPEDPTMRLIADPERMTEMSRAARRRAADFGSRAFSARLTAAMDASELGENAVSSLTAGPTSDVTAVECGADIYYGHTYWNDLPQVRAVLDRRMAGGPWWRKLRETIGTPARCALILNCGNGHVERALIEYDVIHSAVGVDFAQDLLESARRAAEEADMPVYYHQMDTNTAVFPVPDGGYDLVVNHAAGHHLTHVDSVFRKACELLPEAGWFVHFDYTGPHRNQYTQEMWDRACAVNLELPEELRQEMGYPHLPTMLVTDASEAVGSELVLPVFHRYFEVTEERHLGGGIAYLLLTHNERMFAADAEARAPWIEHVIAADEAYLAEAGGDASLFTYAIGRPRKSVLDDAAALERWRSEEEAREHYASEHGGEYYPRTPLLERMLEGEREVSRC